MDLTKEQILTFPCIIVTEYLEELVKEALGQSLFEATEIKSYQGWWVFKFPFRRMSKVRIYKELSYFNDCKLRRRHLYPIVTKLKLIKKYKENGINVAHV